MRNYDKNNRKNNNRNNVRRFVATLGPKKMVLTNRFETPSLI